MTLAELSARLRALEADHAALWRRLAALESDDVQFVRAVGVTTEGHRFSVDELFDHARLHGELRAALRGATCVQVGKRLQRLAGRAIGGLLVQRVGRDGNGVLWVVSAADLHSPLCGEGA